jgi:hypothetical protein
MKKFILTALSLILLISLMIVGIFLKNIYFFKANVTEDICIEQKLMTSVYDIIDCSEGTVIAYDVHGWIINGNLFYGSYGDNYFFSFHMRESDILKFRTMNEFNIYLNSHKLPDYDVNMEENISHIKFGNGRNRKY